MFHPTVSQEEHEDNIRRYNLALRAMADREQRSLAEVEVLRLSRSFQLSDTSK